MALEMERAGDEHTLMVLAVPAGLGVPSARRFSLACRRSIIASCDPPGSGWSRFCLERVELREPAELEDSLFGPRSARLGAGETDVTRLIPMTALRDWTAWTVEEVFLSPT
mmetsp:Transcript_26756/g.70281  ORF Transcript_26756/g.70281 Transcript_26756/m.70281 type:complete len:111 (+) Transcript_26756:386-718(+)